MSDHEHLEFRGKVIDLSSLSPDRARLIRLLGGAAIALFLLIFFATSVYQVEPDEVAVNSRARSAKLRAFQVA